MELLYRKELIKQYMSPVGILWLAGIVSYLKTLGIESDEEDCVSKLTSIEREEDYVGIWNSVEVLPENANYIMIEQSTGERYWFTSAYDAIFFVNYKNGIERDLVLMGYSQSSKTEVDEYFEFYRTFLRNGFWWLKREDEPWIMNIMARPPLIFCETKKIQFANVDDAAKWLVLEGRAANISIAKTQLNKHLRGETASCYKMKFIEY